MNRLITKFGLVLLLGGAVLSGCSEEEKDLSQIGAASFFKVSVSTSDFTESSRSVGMAADTIITPLDSGLYMETIISNAPVSGTRSHIFNGAVVESGTLLTIIAYEGKTYRGKMTGTVGANGSVTLDTPQSPLTLESGKDYIFTCVANAEITSDNTGFISQIGRNSMGGDTNVTIEEGASQCLVDFKLIHQNGRLETTITSDGAGTIGNLSAKLCGTNWPISFLMTINNGGGWADGGTSYGDADLPLFNGMSSDSEVTGTTYLCGVDHSVATNKRIVFTGGTIGDKDMTNTEIPLPDLNAWYNQRTLVNIKIVRHSVPVIPGTVKEENWSTDIIDGGDYDLTL